MTGFVKLDPNIWKSELFNDFVILKLWLYILCNAAYKEKDIIFNGSVHHLEKGQLIVGRKSLAQVLRTAESKVYRSLSALKEMGYIEIKANNKFSLITAINKDFCDSAFENSNSKRTTGEQQTNSKRTTNEQQADTTIDIIDNIDSIDRVDKPAPRGCCNNVYLSDEEYEALKEEYCEYQRLIDNLSLKMASSGKSYPSHYATILKWAKEDGVKPRRERSFDPEEFFNIALKASMV